jgi:putative tricarboxylic transport membrane protein
MTGISLKSDQATGLIWFALGVYFCVESIKLNLGSLNTPGPGFLSFLAGFFLALLGLLLMLSSILKKLGRQNETKSIVISVKSNWKYFGFVLIILFSYALLFEPVGFFLTTFFFFFFLFKLTEPKKWLMPLIFSGTVVILSYFLFSVLLKCQFPKGPFKF